MLDRLRQLGFDLEARNHAAAILSVDFAEATAELIGALADYSLTPAEIVASGGGEAPSTQRLRRRLHRAGWRKHNFVFETKVDGATREAISHEIDHVKRCDAGVIALEIEWNNKDPFFDRDLETFQRLHAQSVISVGVLITRGQSLQDGLRGIVADFVRRQGALAPAELEAHGMKPRTPRQTRLLQRLLDLQAPFDEAFAKAFVADKYGQATTHWRKLADRVARGVGNPCPLLLIGLPLSVVQADYSAATVPEL